MTIIDKNNLNNKKEELVNNYNNLTRVNQKLYLELEKQVSIFIPYMELYLKLHYLAGNSSVSSVSFLMVKKLVNDFNSLESALKEESVIDDKKYYKIISLNSALNEYYEKMNYYTEELEKAKKEIEVLKSNSQDKELRKKIKQLEDSKSDLEAEFKEKIKKIENDNLIYLQGKEEVINELKKQKRELEKEIKKYKQNSNILIKSDTSGLENEIISLKKDNKFLENNYMLKLEEKNKEIKNLREKIKKLKERKEDVIVSEPATGLDEKIRLLEKQVKSLIEWKEKLYEPSYYEKSGVSEKFFKIVHSKLEQYLSQGGVTRDELVVKLRKDGLVKDEWLNDEVLIKYCNNMLKYLYNEGKIERRKKGYDYAYYSKEGIINRDEEPLLPSTDIITSFIKYAPAKRVSENFYINTAPIILCMLEEGFTGTELFRTIIELKNKGVSDFQKTESTIKTWCASLLRHWSDSRLIDREREGVTYKYSLREGSELNNLLEAAKKHVQNLPEEYTKGAENHDNTQSLKGEGAENHDNTQSLEESLSELQPVGGISDDFYKILAPVLLYKLSEKSTVSELTQLFIELKTTGDEKYDKAVFTYKNMIGVILRHWAEKGAIQRELKARTYYYYSTTESRAMEESVNEVKKMPRVLKSIINRSTHE